MDYLRDRSTFLSRHVLHFTNCSRLFIVRLIVTQWHLLFFIVTFVSNIGGISFSLRDRKL